TAMVSPSFPRRACRWSGWATPQPWEVSSDGSRQFMSRWRTTIGRASSFNELQAGGRAGVATASPVPVDGPERTKDNTPYDRAERNDQTDQAAHPFDHGAHG